MLALITAVGVALAMLLVGGLMTDIGPWYQALRKPRWNPPNWLFGPAWTTILGLGAWAADLALTHAAHTEEFHLIVGCLGAAVILHLLWSPLFFKFKRPDWALIDILVLWLSILALIIAVKPVSVLAAALLAPYFLWVSFATLLNLFIVRLNAPF